MTLLKKALFTLCALWMISITQSAWQTESISFQYDSIIITKHCAGDNARVLPLACGSEFEAPAKTIQDFVEGRAEGNIQKVGVAEHLKRINERLKRIELMLATDGLSVMVEFYLEVIHYALEREIAQRTIPKGIDPDFRIVAMQFIMSNGSWVSSSNNVFDLGDIAEVEVVLEHNLARSEQVTAQISIKQDWILVKKADMREMSWSCEHLWSGKYAVPELGCRLMYDVEEILLDVGNYDIEVKVYTWLEETHTDMQNNTMTLQLEIENPAIDLEDTLCELFDNC